MTPFEIALTVVVIFVTAFLFFASWWNQRHSDNDDKPKDNDPIRT